MAGLYSLTTRTTGTTLTANIYNTDHQNHIDNHITTQMDDYSANAAEMRSTTNPGEVGSESLATSLAGELERIRFILKEFSGGTQWYTSRYCWAIRKYDFTIACNTLLRCYIDKYFIVVISSCYASMYKSHIRECYASNRYTPTIRGTRENDLCKGCISH